MLILLAGFVYVKPQQFANIWLTKDQQGQILFKLEKYDLAAKVFTNTRWQAFSLYGAEQFEQASLLYSQYDHVGDRLAKGNALAHARRYVKARAVYQAILNDYPENSAALQNLAIVQAIIDEVNRMSESQKAEEGDSPKELGDEPQTGEGADKKEAQTQEIEQLSAEQLLLDANLNDMWLRQVQKNPAQFLGQKFHMQLQRQESELNAKGAENDQ
ncbi:hypothetical protein RGQ13_09205 [Thalassotalea psychrophila]|uniref:Uncharacterized protein n=1 Tax=Thalassotalea psychrophila TaxID=3065647 RepID=A0ABY9U5E4_9GAMM|nr:hypothetical protein RGQ13_09205 [Colwelliaceae bacterium SQ149]